MAKFVPLTITLILLSIFSLSLLAGFIDIQTQNNAPLAVDINNSYINDLYNDLNSNISTSVDGFNSASNTFENSSINTGGNNIYIDSLSGVWKTIKRGPVDSVTTLLNVVYTEVFGANRLYLAVVLAILSIIIISAVAKLIMRGEGD